MKGEIRSIYIPTALWKEFEEYQKKIQKDYDMSVSKSTLVCKAIKNLIKKGV